MTQEPNKHRSDSPRRVQKKKKPTPGGQKKREKIIMVVAIILAVIMVLAATVVVLYNRWVQRPTLPVNDDPTTSSSAVSLAPGESEEPLDIDAVAPLSSGERKSEDYYTILVFGADETSGLTDTIMVVSYDVTNQQATVMSIPRDTLVNSSANGVTSKKINATYNINGGGEEGIQALKDRVAGLVGFVPDYYVMIDWELVGQMVDAIGGVYFDIPYHMDYDDPYQGLSIHFEPGYQYLDGEDAMQVVRWRKNNEWSPYANEGGGSDINRLNVQHQFLKAVLEQTLQLKNVTRIGQLAELFGENVTSDLTIENLFWFGSQAIFGGLNVDDVEFVTMPYANASYPYRDGSTWRMASFVYPVQNQLLEIINDSLNPYVTDVTLRELDLIYPNSSGGISSTSGRLADPSMATLPAAYLEWRDGQEDPEASLPVDDDEQGTENDPDASQDPAASPSPGASSDPTVSGDPAVSPSPGTSEDPAASGSPAASGAPSTSDAPVTSTAPTTSPAPAESTAPTGQLPTESQSP